MSMVPVEDEILSSLKTEEEDTLFSFPFSAIVGANTAKKALLLVLVNPDAGPLLIHGERETGKSTLLSSVQNLLPSVPFHSINYMTPDDMIFRGSDSAVERASGGFLLVERLNILDSKTVVRIMAAAEQFLFTVLATMNDEDAPLSPKIAGKFLRVRMDRVTDLEERIEVIKRVKEFRQDPVRFSSRFRGERRIAEEIEAARKILRRVQVDDRVMSSLKKEIRRYPVSVDAALPLLKANAALNGRTWCTGEDIEDIIPILAEQG